MRNAYTILAAGLDSDLRDSLRSSATCISYPMRLVFAEDGPFVELALLQCLKDSRETIEECPDMLLLAPELATREGGSLLEWVRSQARLPKFPVILVARERKEPEIIRSYQLGCNSFLVVPRAPIPSDHFGIFYKYWFHFNVSPVNSYVFGAGPPVGSSHLTFP